MTLRKKITTPLPTFRSKERVYQFPEVFYLKENIALYLRARHLCVKYNLPYPEARKKYLEQEEKRFPSS